MQGVATQFAGSTRHAARGMDSRAPANPTAGKAARTSGPDGRLVRAWRWAKRIFLGGALLGLLAAAVLFFGWRYGFTRLPVPVPGWQFKPVTLLAWEAVGPDNFWYWPYQLGQTRLANSAGYRSLSEANELWCLLGSDAVKDRDRITAWLNEHQLIAGMRAVALSRTNRALPERAAFLDSGCRLIIDFSLWQAAEAERAGRPAEAFGELLRAWRFEPYGNWSPQQWQIAAAWRRLALTGPAIDRATARRLMDELTGIAASLPSPDWAVRQSIGSRFASEWPRAETPDPPVWRNVSAEFRYELEALWHELPALPDSIFKVFSDSSERESFRFHGLSRLLRPFGAVLDVAVQRATRREDLLRMRDACFGQALSRLKLGDTEAALAWVRELDAAVQGKPVVLRFLDRPVVWEEGRSVIEVEIAIRRLRTIQANLEVCRLTLALRLYLDEHGVWPAQLADLVPDYLPALPADPFGAPSFAYECTTNRWGLWADGLDRATDKWAAAERSAAASSRAALGFVSDEFEIRRRQHEREQTNALTPGQMSAVMMQRYGLVSPKMAAAMFMSRPSPQQVPVLGATNTTPATTNSLSAAPDKSSE